VNKIFLLLLSFFLPLSIFSQSLVSGIVIRSDNAEPVPFVNIIVTELGKGTVSNLDGEFNFRLPANAPDSMEVVFSHIGFESTTLKVSDLKSSPIQVKLIPSEYELDQAIVLDFDPKVILERAQDNLIKTQYGQPYEIDVFYRELIWGNDTIQGFTRASGYMHSEGYQESHSKRKNVSGNSFNQLAFDQIQKTDYGILTSVAGHPRNAVADGIFPSMIFRLWDFNTKWFDYELLGGKKIGDREVFVLAINARNSGVKRKSNKWGFSTYGLLEKAVFYIDQGDYGIHMMELSQQYTGEKQLYEKLGQTHSEQKRDGVVKYQRKMDGDYVFTYSNYTNYYTDYGFYTEADPKVWKVKEYAELFATDYEFVNLSSEQLREKYRMGVSGIAPNRSLNPHVEWYNSWIFIKGRARYNPDFWASYSYPGFPGEQVMEEYLSRNESLEAQFSEFSNNQMYLLPILRRRHGLRESIWDITELRQSSYSSY
jgi:hypothetical protein